MIDNQKVCAIITAAGSSKRMGFDKILAILGGKPVIVRVIDTFQKCKAIDEIVVVLSTGNIKTCMPLIYGKEWSKVKSLCPGGERRQDSVAAGLAKLSNCGWVVIHDGARPLITTDLILRGLEAAKETGAAIAAVPVTDTIKIAGDDMLVQQTPPRKGMWAVQTPQVFRFDIIAESCNKVKDNVTDDASMVEQLGYKVKLYMGAYDNIKITTPDDLILAEALLKKRGK